MEWFTASDEYLPPVRCPKCGERQNRFSGRMTQEKQEFHRIDCMVCGREFDAEEYQDLVTEARSERITPLGHRS